MFSLGHVLFNMLQYSSYFFIPVTIAVLVVSLIVRSSSAPKTTSSTPNSGIVNVMLYIGSFFIVGSMLMMIGNQPDIMPAMIMAVTAVSFLAGICLYKTVDYLRPVATAFTYTSIALFPFWYFAFNEMGLDHSVSFLLSSTFSLIACTVSAIAIESRISGWLSYIWLIIFGWSVASVIDTAGDRHSVLTYASFVWPILVAYIPIILWNKRVKWLPVAFRHATRALASGLIPVFVALSVFNLLVPNITTDYPLLRTFIALSATGGAAISFAFNRKHTRLLALRLFAQAFVFFLVADIAGYSSIAAGASSRPSEATSIIVSITWLVTWLAQLVISMFLPQRNKEEYNIEKVTTVISIIGILLASALCPYTEKTTQAAISIATCSIIGIVGCLLSFKFKNILWSIATVVAAAIVPITINYSLCDEPLNSWVMFTIYLTLGVFAAAIYSMLYRYQPKKCFGASITAIVIFGLLSAIYASVEGWSSLGWFIAAAELGVLAAVSRKPAFLEATAYVGALSLYSLVGDVQNATMGHTRDTLAAFLRFEESDVIIDAIRIHIPIVTLLGFGFMKERKMIASPRIIIGYALLATTMYNLSHYDRGAAYTAIGAIFLIEEVAFALIGMVTRRTWMVIASAALAVLELQVIADGSQSIWLLAAGIAIIVVVAWQLTKNSKQQKPVADSAKPPVVEAETKADDRPADKSEPKAEEKSSESADADKAEE